MDSESAAHALTRNALPARSAFTFELFKNAILSIADEMALTVFRTTYSGVLK
jgi:hypothetical protein